MLSVGQLAPWPSTVEDSRKRLHDEILAKVGTWPEDIVAEWGELAGDLEHGHGYDRARAEQVAFWRIKKRITGGLA